MAFLLQSVMAWTGMASIPDFPFTLCSQAPRISCDFLYGCSSTLLWTLQDGVTQAVNNSSSSLFVLPVGSTVSIFHMSLSTLSESEKCLARNALRRARTLRIHGLLQCLGGTEYKEHIYIATEHCIPLAHYLLADATNPSMLSPVVSSLPRRREAERSTSKQNSVSNHATTSRPENGARKVNDDEKIFFMQREFDAVCWEKDSRTEENDNDIEEEETMEEESDEDNVSVKDNHKNNAKDTPNDTGEIESGGEDLASSAQSTEGTTAIHSSTPMEQRWEWLLFTYSGVSPKTLALGLKTIVKGIHALHANQLHHGNVQPSCVFVAVRTGFWFLFGFEFLSEIGEMPSARQALPPPPSSPFSFSWGSANGGDGSAAGHETGTEGGLSFMSGGHFFARLKELEGQWKEKQVSERSSSSEALSSRKRNNPLGLVPPEFLLPLEVGKDGVASRCHSAELEKEESLLSTSMSGVSKFWNTWMHAGSASVKSAEEMSLHERCTPILSSILEAPWKAAAWDAWGLSRIFYFSSVALKNQMNALCGEANPAAALTVPSYSSVPGAPASGINDGAGREQWEEFSRSLYQVAEQLGAVDPKERLQGASSFADLLRDDVQDQEEGRMRKNSSKSLTNNCWSQEEYVKCIETTEMYPVLEANEKDQLVWSVIKELYKSLHTYVTPISSAMASLLPTCSSESVKHGSGNFWYLTPFSGMLWMIERIMANLYSHIPRRLVVGILLLGQHLLVHPPALLGREEGSGAVAALNASAKKEGAHAAVSGAHLPFDPSSVSLSSFSTVGAFWYDKTMGPLLAYMYRFRENFIRFQLLESTPLYAPYLSSSRWNNDIWPLLAECFQHASQSSVEVLIATVKTTIFASPFLSSAVLAEQVIPSIRKHFIAHADPSLRVNGLLCVSQILPSLAPDRRGPLAAEVYGRGVQDTHDAVRFVSVKGIQKCLQWMTLVQVVKYALPLVIPLAIDRYSPSREMSLTVIEESLHLFRAADDASGPSFGDATTYRPPSRGTAATSVTSASGSSEGGRWSPAFSSRVPTPPVPDGHRSASSSSLGLSLEANPGTRYTERNAQVGTTTISSLVRTGIGTTASEMEEWHFHLPHDHLDALRLLKELDGEIHTPLLVVHPAAPTRRRSLVSFTPLTSTPTATTTTTTTTPPTSATETRTEEPSTRKEWKGIALTQGSRNTKKEKEKEEEEEEEEAWQEEHHDTKGKAKREGCPLGHTNGFTSVVSPTQAMPLAKAARRYSAMFLPPSIPSLPSRLPGSTAKSLDLEGFPLPSSSSPLTSAVGRAHGSDGGSNSNGGGSSMKSIPRRNSISSLRFTAAPTRSLGEKDGESENEAIANSGLLRSAGIRSEGSEMEGVGGSRAEWGSRRGSAFGGSTRNSVTESSTSPLTGSNSDGRGMKVKGSKRAGGGLGARKCD